MKPGGNAVERIAADANVLLSAVSGKAAARVFTRPGLEFVTVQPVLAEVRAYIPLIAEANAIAPEVLHTQLRLFAVREYAEAAYAENLPKAARLIGRRDPDDVPLLALALTLKIPVWSNDRDFERAGVEWYTTARLLQALKL